MRRAIRTPWVVPVFLPHAGCPHRCVFCDQQVVTGSQGVPEPSAVGRALEERFGARRRSDGRPAQIAFYGGSFTGMDPASQAAYLDVARRVLERYGGWGVRVSARPDELCEGRVAFVRERGVRVVEVGVQSLSDAVLARSRRGHDARTAAEALGRLKRMGLETGAQIMVGLPGDRGAESLETVEALCGLGPDFVRLYPVLVLRGSDLAALLREGRYRPPSLEASVALCARMTERLERASIRVVRIGLHAEPWMREAGGAVLAGPLHPAFGDLVRSRVYLAKVLEALRRRGNGRSGLRIRIHPCDRPLLSGHGRCNLPAIRSALGREGLCVREDAAVLRGEVAVDP